MGLAEWSETARQRQVDPFRLVEARMDPAEEKDISSNTPDVSHVEGATSQPQAGVARLMALGVGGGGTNAINRMIEAHARGVEFTAMNTDAQALSLSRATTRIQLGQALTRGLGAGGNPDIGRQAAEESYSALCELLTGVDMAFITAGMGGGTGTGAAPLVAQAAREQGALTVAVVTTPFGFERRRKTVAEQGLAALRDVVDALIIVPNERLMQLAARDMSAFEAYRLADDVLRQGIQGISDLITIPGLINLDFADIRAVMADAGSALMSIGQASGDNRAEEAAQKAITNPLLDVDISGARGVVFNITGGEDLTMSEVNRIADIISGAAHPDANIIFGTVFDKSLAGSLKITVVATGFEPRVTYDPHRQSSPYSIVPPMQRNPIQAPHASSSQQQEQRHAQGPQPAQQRQGQMEPQAMRISAPSAPPTTSAIRVGAPLQRDTSFENFTITPRSAPAPQQAQASQPSRHQEPIQLSRERLRDRSQGEAELSSARPPRNTPVIRDLPRPHQDDFEEDETDDMDERYTAHEPQRPKNALPGYHGDEFVTNDEPVEEDTSLPAPRRPWDRFLNPRH